MQTHLAASEQVLFSSVTVRTEGVLPCQMSDILLHTVLYTPGTIYNLQKETSAALKAFCSFCSRGKDVFVPNPLLYTSTPCTLLDFFHPLTKVRKKEQLHWCSWDSAMHNPTSKFHTFLQSLHFKLSSLTGKRFGDSRGYENQNRTASCLFSFRIPGNHANIDWIRPAGIHGVVQGMGRLAGINGMYRGWAGQLGSKGCSKRRSG